MQIAQPVNYSWTLMLALISSFIFKQKLSGKEIFWILFAYTGVLIISLGNSSTIMQANSLSLFYILISTILYAVYWIYNTAVKLPANIKLFLGFLGASLLGFITLFFRNEPFVLPQDAIPPHLLHRSDRTFHSFHTLGQSLTVHKKHKQNRHHTPYFPFFRFIMGEQYLKRTHQSSQHYRLVVHCGRNFHAAKKPKTILKRKYLSF